jgi:hypothetical protein
MKNISDLRNAILAAAAEEFKEIGLARARPGGATFARQEDDCLKMGHVSFLDKSHAGRFNANTACFSIELGVFYRFIPRLNGTTASIENLPAYFECHVRGHLLKNIKQNAPISGYSGNNTRRDIWWVEASGNDVATVSASLRSVIKRKAHWWLRRYSSLRFACLYLKWFPAVRPSAPINLGRRGCPYRTQLIESINQRLGPK